MSALLGLRGMSSPTYFDSIIGTSIRVVNGPKKKHTIIGLGHGINDCDVRVGERPHNTSYVLLKNCGDNTRHRDALMLLNGFAKNVNYTNLQMLINEINSNTIKSKYKISNIRDYFEPILVPLSDYNVGEDIILHVSGVYILNENMKHHMQVSRTLGKNMYGHYITKDDLVIFEGAIFPDTSSLVNIFKDRNNKDRNEMPFSEFKEKLQSITLSQLIDGIPHRDHTTFVLPACRAACKNGVQYTDNKEDSESHPDLKYNPKLIHVLRRDSGSIDKDVEEEGIDNNVWYNTKSGKNLTLQRGYFQYLKNSYRAIECENGFYCYEDKLTKKLVRINETDFELAFFFKLDISPPSSFAQQAPNRPASSSSQQAPNRPASSFAQQAPNRPASSSFTGLPPPPPSFASASSSFTGLPPPSFAPASFAPASSSFAGLPKAKKPPKKRFGELLRYNPIKGGFTNKRRKVVNKRKTNKRKTNKKRR